MKCQEHLAKVRRLAKGKRTKAKQRATGKALAALRQCKTGGKSKSRRRRSRKHRRRSRRRSGGLFAF